MSHPEAIVELDHDTTEPDPLRRDVEPTVDPPQTESVATVDDAEPSPTPIDPETSPDPPEDLIPSVEEPIKIATTPPKPSLRWTEVSGLLAQMNTDADQSSGGRALTWTRIQGGSKSSGVSSSRPTDRQSFRTLPFSRAKGELSGGGGIIVAADTGLQIAKGADDATTEVDLMYGSIALIDVAEGTTIHIRQGGQTLATLRWPKKASAVVHRKATGVQIQVNGEVEVNDTPVRAKSVQVASDRSMETVRAPRRLPTWVNASNETSDAERLILAQIADTDDLTGSLNRTIGALAANQKLDRDQSQTLIKLASWQAAMAGPNVFRLANSRVPAVRFAALQRLAQLSDSDPRYRRTWNTVERTVNNQQRVTRIRAWFRIVQSGVRPNQKQLEQMIQGLQERDFASRAAADFMLRQYVGNPPPFDPSWTGPTLQRAVNVYRQRAGLPTLRPNAAASSLQ